MESGHLIKINVCLWHAITTPWKKMVKFGTSFGDRSFQPGASHMKDHGFPKETSQFKLLWPLTSSFGLINISTVRNHKYTTGFIFWRISCIISYI